MRPLGSAAILTALPDIVGVTADAFPHSAGEATGPLIAHKDTQFGE